MLPTSRNEGYGSINVKGSKRASCSPLPDLATSKQSTSSNSWLTSMATPSWTSSSTLSKKAMSRAQSSSSLSLQRALRQRSHQPDQLGPASGNCLTRKFKRPLHKAQASRIHANGNQRTKAAVMTWFDTYAVIGLPQGLTDMGSRAKKAVGPRRWQEISRTCNFWCK